MLDQIVVDLFDVDPLVPDAQPGIGVDEVPHRGSCSLAERPPRACVDGGDIVWNPEGRAVVRSNNILSRHGRLAPWDAPLKLDWARRSRLSRVARVGDCQIALSPLEPRSGRAPGGVGHRRAWVIVGEAAFGAPALRCQANVRSLTTAADPSTGVDY